MKLKTIRLKTKTYFDDPAVPPTVPPPPPPPPPPTTFTQEQVNKMMAEHRKGLQDENKKLVDQLTQIRDTANLTAQQKEELEARIGTLSQQHLTEAQKLQAEAEANRKKLETTQATLTAEANKWKQQFVTTVATQAIIAGAAEHKAANPRQLVAMLNGQVKVVEEVDDKGQPTGAYVAKMPVAVTDPKSKAVTVIEMPVIEAIGKMREQSDHANLFLTDGKPGLGGSGGVGAGSGGSGGQPDFSKMTPQEYTEYRKKLGIKTRF